MAKHLAPNLPGNPRRRRAVIHKADSPEKGDTPTNSSLMSSERVQQEILKQLAIEPCSKQTLRDLLHVNETRVLIELKALKRAGRVGVLILPGTPKYGHHLRKWALTENLPVVEKPKPPKKKKRGKFPRPLAERYADLFD